MLCVDLYYKNPDAYLYYSIHFRFSDWFEKYLHHADYRVKLDNYESLVLLANRLSQLHMHSQLIVCFSLYQTVMGGIFGIFKPANT